MPARITGRERVVARLSGMSGQQAVQRVGEALFAGGELIRAEAAHLITEGAVSGKNHVPSLPGEPPNEDTGVLRTHIETAQVAPLRVEVSSNAPYAVALEAGTSKMAARPYMGPATQHKRKEVVALVRRAVTRAVKGA
jgi:HK97 gp10 family phage protein